MVVPADALSSFHSAMGRALEGIGATSAPPIRLNAPAALGPEVQEPHAPARAADYI